MRANDLDAEPERREPPSPYVVNAIEEQTEGYRWSVADWLGRQGLPVETRRGRGPAARGIVATATQEHVALICMATRGHGGLGRLAQGHVADALAVMSTHWHAERLPWTDGSIAAAVLRHVAVPLLVVPRRCSADWSERRPARVLVAVDGSDLSNAALVPVADLARLLGAVLRLLSVVVPSAYVPIEGYPNPIAGSTVVPVLLVRPTALPALASSVEGSSRPATRPSSRRRRG